MATWQFDSFVVYGEDASPVLADDGWTLPQLPAASTLRAQDILIEALGRPWPMLEDWIVFGDETSTRVDFVFDDDKVEISIRLSVSATNGELGAICRFTNALNGRFFDPATLALIHADRSALACALASSPAAAFARAVRVAKPGVQLTGRYAGACSLRASRRKAK